MSCTRCVCCYKVCMNDYSISCRKSLDYLMSIILYLTDSPTVSRCIYTECRNISEIYTTVENISMYRNLSFTHHSSRSGQTAGPQKILLRNYLLCKTLVCVQLSSGMHTPTSLHFLLCHCPLHMHRITTVHCTVDKWSPNVHVLKCITGLKFKMSKNNHDCISNCVIVWITFGS